MLGGTVVKMAVTYLTRRCLFKCSYCALRDSSLNGEELSAEQWIEAFDRLIGCGIVFNLILGNECWMLGGDLLKIFEKNRIPFAMYTNCPPGIFERWRDELLGSGVIDNVSCGVDYPLSWLESKRRESGFENFMELKSWYGWRGLLWVREHYEKVDTHATITISRLNIDLVEDWVRETKRYGIFGAINFIHWNKDGRYDFFPVRESLKGIVFEGEDRSKVGSLMRWLHEYGGLVQNIEIMDVDEVMEMGWHCKGSPYGGVTIDADGSLRCCGYRKGIYSVKYSIWDLPKRFDEYTEAVRRDALECPGCCWTFPWQAHFWEEKREEDFGRLVFVKHAGKHIDSSLWSKRRVE